MENPHAELAPI